MTLPPSALAMTAELRDELARNDFRARRVDPRTVPLRFHHLKAMGSCAAKCFESFQRDDGDNLAKRLGSGTHAIMFDKPVKLYDRPSEASVARREKAQREGKPLPPLTAAPRNGKEWDKFVAENRDAVVLIKSEYDEAIRMATAIRNNPQAAEWLSEPGLVCEDTILWTQAGRSRRSTPDMRSPRRVTEVKTTRSAKPEQFRWDVKRFFYHAQLVDQARAVQAKFGKRPEELCIIAVEKTRPYVVQTYRLTPRDIELGEQILGSWFNAFRVAEDSDAWGGYADGTLELNVPDDGDDGEIVFGVEEEDAEPEDEHEPPF